MDDDSPDVGFLFVRKSNHQLSENRNQNDQTKTPQKAKHSEDNDAASDSGRKRIVGSSNTQNSAKTPFTSGALSAFPEGVATRSSFYSTHFNPWTEVSTHCPSSTDQPTNGTAPLASSHPDPNRNRQGSVAKTAPPSFASGRMTLNAEGGRGPDLSNPFTRAFSHLSSSLSSTGSGLYQAEPFSYAQTTPARFTFGRSVFEHSKNRNQNDHTSSLQKNMEHAEGNETASHSEELQVFGTSHTQNSDTADCPSPLSQRADLPRERVAFRENASESSNPYNRAFSQPPSSSFLARPDPSRPNPFDRPTNGIAPLGATHPGSHQYNLKHHSEMDKDSPDVEFLFVRKSNHQLSENRNQNDEMKTPQKTKHPEDNDAASGSGRKRIVGASNTQVSHNKQGTNSGIDSISWGSERVHGSSLQTPEQPRKRNASGETALDSSKRFTRAFSQLSRYSSTSGSGSFRNGQGSLAETASSSFEFGNGVLGAFGERGQSCSSLHATHLTPRTDVSTYRPISTDPLKNRTAPLASSHSGPVGHRPGSFSSFLSRPDSDGSGAGSSTKTTPDTFAFNRIELSAFGERGSSRSNLHGAPHESQSAELSDRPVSCNRSIHKTVSPALGQVPTTLLSHPHDTNSRQRDTNPDPDTSKRYLKLKPNWGSSQKNCWTETVNTLDANSFENCMKKCGEKIMEKCRRNQVHMFHLMMRVLIKSRNTDEFNEIEFKVRAMIRVGLRYLSPTFLLELDRKGDTLMSLAIESNSVRLFQALFKRKAPLPSQTRESSPVQLAIKWGNAEILAELLKMGQQFHYFVWRPSLPLKGEDFEHFQKEIRRPSKKSKYSSCVQTMERFHHLIQSCIDETCRPLTDKKIKVLSSSDIFCFPRQGIDNEKADYKTQVRVLNPFEKGNEFALMVMSAKYDYDEKKFIGSIDAPKLRSMPRMENVQCLANETLGPIFFTVTTRVHHHINCKEKDASPNPSQFDGMSYLSHPELYTISMNLDRDPEFSFVVCRIIEYKTVS